MGKTGRHVGPTSRRISRGWITPLALVLSLLMGSIAWADGLVVDGDGLTPVVGNTMSVGSVCIGQVRSANALLAIQRTQGGSTQNVFKDSSSVTLSAGSPTSPNVSVGFTDSAIAMPSNWGGTANNTIYQTDIATSAVSVTGVGPVGAKSATVGYTATGTAANNGALTRAATLTVNWSVASCDTTPPVITPNVTGTFGDNGWYVGNVSVSWTVTDPESAVSSSSGCGSTSISVDTSGTTLTCSANSAGGPNSQSVTIKRDATTPSASASATPAPNGSGWNNGDVTVSFTGSDALSTIASCSAPVTLSSDGASQSASGTCTDMAGNVSAPATASDINIDKTKPVVSASAAPVPNANGWNNSDVVVSFSGTDNGSGIAACDSSVTLSSEAAGQSATGSCTDKAGNSASATAANIKIDKTKPAVSVTGVVAGATYNLGSVLTPGCSTNDALSGVATEATVAVSGGPVVGSFTATCSGATDNAGNGGDTVSVTYSVIYVFTGFFRPVDNLPTMNVAKAGSAIPIKFSLSGNQGLGVIATGFPRSVAVTCPNVNSDVIATDETVTAGGSSLSYDQLSDQYNYVWKTDKSWSGCRRLDVKFIDGQTYSVLFKFNK